MGKIQLTAQEKRKIENAERQLLKPQLLKRLQAIKLRDLGWSNAGIAEFLLISDQTVSDWSRTYQKEGLERLLQWNYRGKTSTLTPRQQQQLRERNKEKPFESAAQAKEFIRKEFGISFHLHWVQKVLKKNFHLHSRRPG